MYNQNPEHKGVGGGGAPPMAAAMSPRISFSNDFVESSRSHSHSHPHSHSNTRAAAYRDAPVSSDFEFSKSNYSIISADELDEGAAQAKLDEGAGEAGRWRGCSTTAREAGRGKPVAPALDGELLNWTTGRGGRRGRFRFGDFDLGNGDSDF